MGSTPIASTIIAGAMVRPRRRNSGIERRMKPCITTWPARVPTDDDESPDARRAIPNMVWAWPPTTVPSTCEARWMVVDADEAVGVEHGRGRDQHGHVDDARRSSSR